MMKSESIISLHHEVSTTTMIHIVKSICTADVMTSHSQLHTEHTQKLPHHHHDDNDDDDHSSGYAKRHCFVI